MIGKFLSKTLRFYFILFIFLTPVCKPPVELFSEIASYFFFFFFQVRNSFMMSISLFTRLVLISIVFGRQSVVYQEVWDQSPDCFTWSYWLCFTTLSSLWFELGTFLSYSCHSHFCRRNIRKYKWRDLLISIILELLWPQVHKKASIALEKPKIGGHICPYANPR